MSTIESGNKWAREIRITRDLEEANELLALHSNPDASECWIVHEIRRVGLFGRHKEYTLLRTR